MPQPRSLVPPFGVLALGATVAALPVLGFACAASHEDSAPPPAVDAGSDAPRLDTAPSDTAPPAFDVGEDVPPDTAPPPDPTTCDEAKTTKSYLGCDFWPTVTANRVWEVFDFAAIVANAGDVEAHVTVTGPGGFTKEAIVGPNRLVKVYLPWVPALKGPQGDSCGIGDGVTASVRADASAYHVVTTRPVAVYQFNALEYKGEGGPGGKSWAACPGDDVCKMPDGTFTLPLGCFSFTNDASLLLPTTALTGNYRVTGQHGAGGANPFIAITGVEDGTDVTITLGAKSRIIAGDGIVATSAGKEAKFKLGQGDVLELVGGASVSSDFSGSLIQATKPIQVVSGVPCIQQPTGIDACDHVEESVFPAETLGKHYLVSVPTGPNGDVVGHIVRIYGNVDGTTLTYKPTAPKGAPTTINAGGVYDLAVVADDFEVTGDQSFAVGSFMLGGTLLDPFPVDGIAKGDPSQSMISAVEQFRLKYVFLAPDDYPVSFVDVVGPEGTKLTLDGDPVTEIGTPIGTTGFGVTRIRLGAGEVGAHALTATKPIGIQVMGYGEFTSYQYPGGLNLQAIAPPPVK